MKRWRPRDRLLGHARQTLPLSPFLLKPLLPDNDPRPPVLHPHNLHSHAPRRALQPLAHLPQHARFVKAQFPLKHRLRRLALVQAALQRLHERHRFLHLAHFRDLRRQDFVVEGGGAVAVCDRERGEGSA